MNVVSSEPSEPKKRPDGILIIAILWTLTSIVVINRGVETVLLDFSYDPSAPELLDLSTYAREWLGFGVPVDIVLNSSIVALSLLTVFAAYGLFTAKSWSHEYALVIPMMTALISGATATLYISAPVELGWSIDLPLYSALTLISLGWVVVTWVYLGRKDVKQYILGSSFKPTSSIGLTVNSSSPISPPRWGTREGEILKAIASAGRPLTWNEIRQATGLNEDSLNKTLSKLFRAKAIQKIGDKGEMRYKVSYELYKGYQAQLRLDSSIERRNELVKWINQWKDVRKLDFSLEHEHFFLEGRHLDDFSKELISHAKSDVLVVNPFIQHCDLSNTLMDVKKKGINVQIITRPPQDRYQDKLERKQEYHSKLKNEGISLVYNEKVHAKLIVVDNAVAIISSMNFYPDSSAGASWEAGIISTDKKVVDSIVSSPFSRLT